VSELVVDLADETSVELAWQILKLVRTDHTVSAASRSSASPARAKPELPPWEADTQHTPERSESVAEPSEPDPWAVSAQRQETPAEAATEPSAATSDPDEDNPWS
jgi:hypothetical protein